MPASGGIPVADYRGLTIARRGDVMSIPGDTWKFYRADIDPATSLPMDNLTFAGGPATTPIASQHPSVPLAVW